MLGLDVVCKSFFCRVGLTAVRTWEGEILYCLCVGGGREERGEGREGGREERREERKDE